MWVRMHESFVSDLGIDKCLNPWYDPWINHCTLPYFLYAWIYVCISCSYTKFSPFCIDHNIVGKDILQTRPGWTHKREVIRTILPHWPLIQVQHPDTTHYCDYMCVLPADIPHTEIHNPSRSITHSVWPLATQQSLIELCRLSMLHQFCAMRWRRMVEHSRLITSYRGVIRRGTRFHSGSQCFIW